MSIKYKYFPEQKLIYEIVEGAVSIDTLTAFFMELQLDESIRQAEYSIEICS